MISNINPKQSRETIVKYLLIVNAIYLLELLFFKFRGGVPFQGINLSVAVINILGLSLYMVLKKYEPLLEPLLVANRIAKNIDKFAGKING